MKPRMDVWSWALVAGWVIIAAMLIYPLQSIVTASFTSNLTGEWSLENYATIFKEKQYYRSLINTFIGGFGGMCGALILGITLAAFVSRFQIKGRAFISTIAVMALVTPPFIGAYSWIILFGANGVVRKGLMSLGITIPPIYGMWGVILVFSLKLFPHVFLLTSAALQNIDASLDDAAESLGMPPMQRFFHVTLRLITPAVTASALLTFILSIADFGTPRFIGRQFQMLSTEAYVLFSSETGGNPGMASAISIMLLLISLVFVIMQRWAARHDLSQGSKGRTRVPAPLKGLKSVVVHGITYLIIFAGILPTLVVVLFSFRKTRGPVFQSGFSLDSYRAIWNDVPLALGNSLTFSTASVTGIVIAGAILGYVIVRRRNLLSSGFDAVLMVPYIVPGIVMGIAYAASFNTDPVVLTGTGFIIIAATFIRRLPYGMRAMIASLHQVSPSIEQAGVSLGYHPARVFTKVTVPLIAPGILAGAIMSFVTAMNELSTTLVLYIGSTITMPVKIYTLVSNGEYGTGSALSTILLTITGLLVYFAFRVGKGRQVM
ncbi:iron ABC transporter permease [Desulfovibrio sp. OttesenSCG-928-I05]|nr:iron ABC transporter permease [Desulfovibrio sp. OttesenSCG-928-I05]